MKKSIINTGVDSISFLCATLVLATGLVLAYTLPAGSGRMGLVWLTFSRHSWSEIHTNLAITLVGLMALHLWLHWGFIRAQLWGVAGSPGVMVRRAASVVALALVSALLLLSLLVPAQSGEPSGPQRRQQHMDFGQ